MDGHQKLRTLVLDGTPPIFELGLDGHKIGIEKEVTGKIKFEKQSDELKNGRVIKGKDGRIYMH